MLDLLIKNGHVIDPANRTDQIGNIAIITAESPDMRKGSRQGMWWTPREDMFFPD